MPDSRRKSREFLLALTLALLPALCLRAAEPAAPVSPDAAAALTAKGSFSVSGARAGDTVEYRLRVEWRDLPAAITVLPPRDELKTPGFTLIGQSAAHLKTASAGSIRNISEFTYLLVAREEGQGRVSPFWLRYRDGLSGRVESLPVEGSMLEIAAARVPFLQRKSVGVVAGGLAAVGLMALFLAAARRARTRRAQKAAPEEDTGDEFTRGVTGLKARCDAADSRLWLRDAEKLCVAYLCRDLGISRVRDVRFEAALNQYRARPEVVRDLARDPDKDLGWTKLRDLFHEARYAGGRKEPHELREACRHLKNCIQGER